MKIKCFVLSLITAAAVMLSGCGVFHQNEESCVSAEISAESSIESSEISAEPSPEPSEEEIKLVLTEEELARVEDLSQKYYVNKLSEELKYHFVKLYTAALDFEKQVQLAVPITDGELSQLMYLMNYDCPELIHLGGDYYPEYDAENNATAVSFAYCMDEKEYKTALGKLSTVKKILEEKTAGKSEYEAEKTVYDYIFDGCLYIEDDSTAGSVYGALVKKKARCEGLSKAFCWSMRKLGFECMCMVGSQQWDPSSMFSSHSWDIVRIDGEYYNVDMTVDNLMKTPGITTTPMYGFFNTNDDATYVQRSPEKIFSQLGIPKCTSTKYNYHIMNGLYVPKDGQAEERTREILERLVTEDGISGVSIKYEDSDDYKAMSEQIHPLLGSCLGDTEDTVYDKTFSFNALSHTILVNASERTDAG